MREYHSSALRLNSGRNALEYILLHRNYSRVYIPAYSCVTLLTPFRRTKTEFIFYQINRHFEPAHLPYLAKNEAILYINYFGMCDNIVQKLAANVSNLIIDNSHSFYSLPHPGTSACSGGASMNAASPTGILMKKITRHGSQCTIRPPISRSQQRPDQSRYDHEIHRLQQLRLGEGADDGQPADRHRRRGTDTTAG